MDELSGSGPDVVWEQTTSADAAPHGWLSVSGGAARDLGPLADGAEVSQVPTISVQDGTVALARSAVSDDPADSVTLHHLASGSDETFTIARDPYGAVGSESYRGQAGDGILVEQSYWADPSTPRVRLLLRTHAEGGTVQDRQLFGDDSEYEVEAADAHGAVVLRELGGSWAYQFDYVDFATGDSQTIYAPTAQTHPQAIEFTSGHVGVVDGATLTEWQRDDLAAGPDTVTLPTDRAISISDDSLAWLQWLGDGQEELWAMPRDGSAPAKDLGGTSYDLSVNSDGVLRAVLYRPDVDAAIQTLRDGRLSTVAGEATPIPAGPARLDGLALSGGVLYSADDSSRRSGVLLSSTLGIGPGGATASTPSRVYAYASGIVHQQLAAAGNRTLVDEGDGTLRDLQAGRQVGQPLTPGENSTVEGFDGRYALVWDNKTTLGSSLYLLHDFQTGADRRVPGDSALASGALYNAVADGTSHWLIRRTDLASGAVTTVGGVNCLPQSLQADGSWVLIGTCGTGTAAGLVFQAGSSVHTPVPWTGNQPVLGNGVLYTVSAVGSAPEALSVQPLGVPGAQPRRLFTLPDQATNVSAQRWAVDRDAPWAAWMDDAGVTHVVWAGTPSQTTARVPSGFSPNGDHLQDTWTPSWSYNRPVSWTVTVSSGGKAVRTLTGTSGNGQVAPVWDGRTTSGTAAPEGRYTWTLAVTDTATGARATAPATGTVVLRRTVPAATVTTPALAGSTGTTSPFTVRWAARTAGAVSYDVGYRVMTSSGGHWVLGPLKSWRTATTATSARFGASGSPLAPVPGQTYRFYVRAHDDAGQTGAWSAAASTGVPLDDRSSQLRYSAGWHSVAAGSAWSGTERDSAAPGAEVTFTADGTVLRIVATKRSNGGRFAVLVDGRQVGVVNTYRSATAWRQVVFTRTLGASIEGHRVELRVLSGSARARATVHLDAVMVTR